MDCPHCGHALLAFRVPPDLLEHAPAAEFAAICTRCLAIESADSAPEDPNFEPIIGAFPAGEAGSAMALAVGLAVESLTLNRAAIGDCMQFVSDQGADPWLVLERLHASGTVQSDADLDRLRKQLAQLLE